MTEPSKEALIAQYKELKAFAESILGQTMSQSHITTMLGLRCIELLQQAASLPSQPEQTLIAQAVEAEREECARAAEGFKGTSDAGEFLAVCDSIARRIRDRARRRPEQEPVVEREQFEKWAFEVLPTALHLHKWPNSERYSSLNTQLAWQAWQAALRAQSQASGPFWACSDCGSSQGFTPHKDWESGQVDDVQCNECGSMSTGEASEVLRELARELADAKESQSEGEETPIGWMRPLVDDGKTFEPRAVLWADDREKWLAADPSGTAVNKYPIALYTHPAKAAPVPPEILQALKSAREWVVIAGNKGYAVGSELARIDTLLATYKDTPQQAPIVPEGWQLVPKDPIAEMLIAGWFGGDELDALSHAEMFADCDKHYAALLAVAPTYKD